MGKKKLFFKISLLIIIQFIFFLVAPLATAKADDLVIEDNGAVVLILTSGREVLSASTGEKKEQKKEETKAPEAPAPAPKVVPLVPANVHSTVTINPTPSNDKKVKTTVNVPSAPSGSKQPQNVINKDVNQVVLQGPKKEPILTIKPNQSNQVTINQGGVTAPTTLPLKIDSQTHRISATTSTGQIDISVLPKQALEGASNREIINQITENKPQISLNQENGKPVYTVQGVKIGKIIGLFELKLPVSLKISAESGKITSQSPLSSFLGPLIR